MTYAELKAEAKAQGYNLIPIRKVEKLLPCTCGSKRREHWYGWKGNKETITLCCSRCGKKVTGSTETEARRNWNEAIKAEGRGETWTNG